MNREQALVDHAPPGARRVRRSEFAIAMLSFQWAAKLGLPVLTAFAVLVVLPPAPTRAQDVTNPEQHFSVANPADLSPDEATTIYRRIVDDMADAYAMSDDPSAVNYRRWRAFSSSPYPSETHGGRFVSNYGNALAGAYGDGQGASLPEGAVLAKDSFSVNADGDVFPGPLFIMEKMAPGFSSEARDWRYTMIMPDGSYFGVTGGVDANRVEFCITCHKAAGDANDHLFFVPEAYRRSD